MATSPYLFDKSDNWDDDSRTPLAGSLDICELIALEVIFDDADCGDVNYWNFWKKK